VGDLHRDSLWDSSVQEILAGAPPQIMEQAICGQPCHLKRPPLYLAKITDRSSLSMEDEQATWHCRGPPSRNDLRQFALKWQDIALLDLIR